MKMLLPTLVLIAISFALQVASAKPSGDDAIRIAEFYRLAPTIEDKIWPGWSKAPAPLILVAADTEFLTHDTNPPKDFKQVANGLYARPRQYPVNLQATFPAFGPPAVMVVGEPANTGSKTSTAWLFVLMHEHFHQLQWAQPGYYAAVNGLGLSRGDNTGMWMLNYPFPYENPVIARAFADLRDLLLRAVNEPDGPEFRAIATEYINARTKFFAQLSPDDHKYFAFQLWQEGIARYTEVKSAEAAASYQPTPQFAALADYEPVSEFAKRKRSLTLDDLKHADLPSGKREVVYPFGATEGFLLDRINPNWKEQYFEHMLSTDSFFASAK
jgi:uncharacterized MAPEG superfamily protein